MSWLIFGFPFENVLKRKFCYILISDSLVLTELLGSKYCLFSVHLCLLISVSSKASINVLKQMHRG